MTQSVTFDDVRKMFEEMIREDRERRAETIREDRERWAENDRQLREQREKHDREAQEQREKHDRDLQAMGEEREQRHLEYEREHAETVRVVKEVSRQIDQLGSRWGEFVEGMVAPACETLFEERGIPVHLVHQRVRAKYPGNRHMEIDLLVVNSSAVVLVEVKSKLRHEDVGDHLERMAHFKEFFPLYEDFQVFGAVAGIVIEENVDRYAMNEGLFVIVQSGESVALANPPEFEPQAW
ncbi:MAG: DUF3782 domain-containing protein [Magnetococcales bacterium]|nr:DUF3782 domain-containing protein [Magnetococcales bacterium]